MCFQGAMLQTLSLPSPAPEGRSRRSLAEQGAGTCCLNSRAPDAPAALSFMPTKRFVCALCPQAAGLGLSPTVIVLAGMWQVALSGLPASGPGPFIPFSTESIFSAII